MITGYFVSVNIPEVPVGEDILATIDFYAINPGALLWQSFLVVDSTGLNLQRLLDAANETGEQGGREKTYNLGPMPDKNVSISFFIFGHPTPAPLYSWDWGLYNAWMNGGPLGDLVYLGSNYKNINPGEVISFSLTKPTAYPENAPPGPVLITCSVTSQSNTNVTAQVKVIVYEGSPLFGHGTQLWTDTKSVSFAPGETKNVQFMRTSIEGTIDRRDVEVEVYVAGQLIIEVEWDDVFYVTVTEPPPGIIKGEIVTKELEVMGDQKYPIPVAATIPQGSKAKIHVEILNTGDVPYKPGMVWQIKGPDGNAIPGGTYDHQAWVTNHPGDDPSHFFEAIATFEFTDTGDYNIEIWLLDQENNTLDYWQGKLCTVGEVVPQPGTFSGVILEVKPLTFAFGDLVELLVSFTAYARDWPSQILWETRVTATLDGLSGTDSQNHTGEDGSRNEQPLHLGAMPNRNLTGEVILEARVSFPYTWVELYRIPISVTVVGAACTVDTDCPAGYACVNGECVPESEECVIGAQKCERGDLYECVAGPAYNFWELIEEDSPECEGEEFPWMTVALIGGGALVVLAALTKKKK